MEEMSEVLAQAFCEDCAKRMQRVVTIIHGGTTLSRLQLDQLHQEFDTMFGGARAVHLPELEHYFRSMARYARYLRNCLKDGHEIDSAAWQCLFKGVKLGQCCGNEMSDCLRHCNSERSRLLQEIENIISSGDV